MAFGDIVGVSANQGLQAIDQGNGKYILQVSTVAGIPTSTVVTKYVVTTAFAVPAPGGAVGNVVQSIANYNTATGALLSTTWTNVTQGTTLAGAPAPANIALQGQNDPYGTQFFNYRALIGSAGISVGDVVQRSVNTDLITNGVIDSWYNITTGAFIPLASAPPASNLSPLTGGSDPYGTQFFDYQAIANSAAVSIGDIVQRSVSTDIATNVPTSIWYNVTTGLLIPPANVPPITDLKPLTSTAVPFNAVPDLYTTVIAWPGANVNDVVQEVVVLDMSQNPPTQVNSVWNNLTQQTTNIAQPPSALNVTPGDSAGATFFDTSEQYVVVAAGIVGEFGPGDTMVKQSIWSGDTNPPTLINFNWINVSNGVSLGAQDYSGQLVSNFKAYDSLSQTVTKEVTYAIATVADFGINVGDLLSFTVITDFTVVPDGNVVISYWNNITQGITDPNNMAFPFVGTYTPIISPSLTSTRPVSTAMYYATGTLGGSYAPNDIIQQVVTYNTDTSVTGAPSVINTVYNNLTQHLDNIAVNLADITPLDVVPSSALPTTVFSFQLTVSAAAQQLPANAMKNGAVISSLTTNIANVYIGGAGVTALTGYPLVPGQSISYAVDNTDAVYVLGLNTTDVIAVTGN